MRRKGEDIYGVDLEQYSEVYNLWRQASVLVGKDLFFNQAD